MHTQKCGNWIKTPMITFSQCQLLAGKISLSNGQHLRAVPYTCYSLKCRFSTKIKVVHLCWDKQLMHTGISNCISSLLSQFRTIYLWQVHICQSVISMQGIFAIPTFPPQICLWWMFSVHNFGKIDYLKSFFSFHPCLVPLICILHITQVRMFLDYLTIKFGEYNHQWNCECVILLVSTL